MTVETIAMFAGNVGAESRDNISIPTNKFGGFRQK